MAIPKSFINIIKYACEQQASDVHVRQDEKPYLRINKQLKELNTRVIDERDFLAFRDAIMGTEKSHHKGDVDGAIDLEGVARVRYNFFKHSGKYGIVFRIVNSKIPDFECLHLPNVLSKVAELERGLVLVTGVTGSGKSSTLAAIINYINQHQSKHILSVEDPIEFLFKSQQSKITQREIHTDCESFPEALRSALRQNPDVIVVGELRDKESLSMALKAAETGHLVLSTMHTTNVVNTINRILGLFGPKEHDQVTQRLADSLAAVISQRLIYSQAKQQMLPVLEIMMSNPGIRDCIRGKDDLFNINKYLQKGQSNDGMQTFEFHLKQLIRKKLLSKEEASKASENSDEFVRLLDIED